LMLACMSLNFKDSIRIWMPIREDRDSKENWWR
jgi:hypothetical protein